MQIPEHIFREYDIRGVVDEDLTEDFAFLLGRAYARLAKQANKDNISIGYDCRHSSRPFADALANGIAAGGISATIIGMGPTPVVYWSLFEYGFGGGIQVTGSHNPSNMNGFKICLGKQTLSGQDIQKIKDIVLEIANDAKPEVDQSKISEKHILDNYINYLIENSKPHQGSRKLKIVVDAGNGVAGMIGPKVLRELGHEVIEMYCEPNGDFPNHHPDPTEMKNIKELIERVQSEKADLGIGWDGDGDRMGAIDEQGNPIFGDMAVLIFAREILKEIPQATIIGDVKCSSLLFDDVTNKGGNSVMWKTGHSLIKSKLKELKAELAGEMSGHIFFGHRFYGFDCANYSTCRLVEILSNTEAPLSSLLADLPSVVNTPEIRVDCPDAVKFQVIEAARKEFADYNTDMTDGVRIQFEQGWGLIRASNTQPVVVLRFEAENDQALNQYQELVTSKLEEIKARTLN